MRASRLETFALLAAIALVPQGAAARPVRHPPPRPHEPAPHQPAPAQPAPQPQAAPAQPSSSAPSQGMALPPYESPAKLMEAPVSNLLPGNTGRQTPFRNPAESDPEALQRGMAYFDMFNCSGCHAPNGGGGMGPSLSNRFFIYGGEPQNIYLSIYQGRPNGMPAWGAMLPENIIWDLVAYIGSISKAPSSTWGQTMSRDAFKIEQAPAEGSQTATPWSQTEPFGFGQKPNEAR